MAWKYPWRRIIRAHAKELASSAQSLQQAAARQAAAQQASAQQILAAAVNQRRSAAEVAAAQADDERTAAAEATRVSLAHACRPCSSSPEVGEVLGTSGNAKPPQSEGNSPTVSRGSGRAHVGDNGGAHNTAVSLSSASSSESGGGSSSGEDTDVQIGRLELKRKG